VATLETPSRLQELQRALYQRAKREPKFRFYSLYDKVCRPDILLHAYKLAKANAGAPGPDGQSFEDIEAKGSEHLLEQLRDELTRRRYRPGPIRRVMIPKANGGQRPLGIPNIRDRVVQTAAKLILEPIFEADFESDSYGFRPRKDAHQALAAIKEALHEGMHWVIDADVASFFDEIPHDRLLKSVAERVVDGAMLGLVKMFLEAPVISEDNSDGGRRNRKGTPQGGVISPLLANIYLHLVDRNFSRHVEQGELSGRLVRYADDFVLLCPHRPNGELRWVTGLLDRMGLRLHAEKTRVLDARAVSFNFLGYCVRYRKGRVYFDISAKAEARMRAALKSKTQRYEKGLSEVVAELNPYIRGARQYFKWVRRRTLQRLDYYLGIRMARWWGRKHASRRPAWSLLQGGSLQRQHGLERWYFPWAELR
jgi:RNA-directed DNA polymerase